jgi:hypothetical protein
MPILQVRQVPEELYEELSRTAEADNCSISQETVTLLKEALGWKGDHRVRRKAVLAEISGMPKLKQEFARRDCCGGIPGIMWEPCGPLRGLVWVWGRGPRVAPES